MTKNEGFIDIQDNITINPVKRPQIKMDFNLVTNIYLISEKSIPPPLFVVVVVVNIS